MDLRDYDLKDPGAVVAHVLEHYEPDDNDAYLALVHDPSGAQTVVHVTPVASAEWTALDQYDRSTFLRERVHEMPIDTMTWQRPEHTIVTVVARSGLAVFGRDDSEWLLAWRYSNHHAPLYDAGIVLVTEHGWVDFVSSRGASVPYITRPLEAPDGLR